MSGAKRDKGPKPQGKPRGSKPERHQVYSGEPRPPGIWYKAGAVPDPTGHRGGGGGRKSTIRMESDAGDVFWRPARVTAAKGSTAGIEWLCRGPASHVVAVVTHDS